MAKQIVVLDTNPADGGSIAVRCAMWFPVTVGKEWPLGSGSGSAWQGASAAEVQAIQLGQVIEEVKSFAFPSTTATPDQLRICLSDGKCLGLGSVQ